VSAYAIGAAWKKPKATGSAHIGTKERERFLLKPKELKGEGKKEEARGSSTRAAHKSLERLTPMKVDWSKKWLGNDGVDREGEEGGGI